MSFSGKISEDSRFSVVEFPGIVENPAKATEYLGGISEVDKTLRSSNKRLELRWRPSDVNCKATLASKSGSESVPGFLMKVKVNKKTKEVKNSEIVGLVDSLWTFTEMMDHQYLPITSADGTRGSDYRPIHSISLADSKVAAEVRCPKGGQGSSVGASEDELLGGVPPLLVPVNFTRFPKPLHHGLLGIADTSAQEADATPGAKRGAESPEKSGSMTTGMKKKRKLNHKSEKEMAETLGIRPKKYYGVDGMKQYITSFDQEGVPQAHLDGMTCLPPTLHKAFQAVKQAFEEHPLWTKGALAGRLGNYSDMMSRVVPLLSYTWRTGPWRTMFCRLGYDPRTDASAKMYQLFDFRISSIYMECESKRFSEDPEDGYQARLLGNRPKISANRANQKLTPSLSHLADTQTSEPESWHLFLPGRLQNSKQKLYRVCDIKLPQVEELLRKTAGTEPPKCSKKYGWLPASFYSECSSIMWKHVKELKNSYDKTAGSSEKATADPGQ